jgi:hypothetical protein
MEKILISFREDWSYFQLALKQFEYSMNACASFNLEFEFSETDLEKMEAYAARFARLLDIYTQKILKTIDVLEGYGNGSLRDILNRSAKSGIISNEIDLLHWRILRNEIAHDYIPTEQRRIFFEVMQISSKLLQSIKISESYVNQAKWL